MTTTFSKKLDNLIDTVELGLSEDVSDLSRALSKGKNKFAVAVGSGGSLVSSEYFAVVRHSLEANRTDVRTPLEFVLGNDDISQGHVWLFSARGENLDIVSSLRAAVARQAQKIHIVTSNPEGLLVRKASSLTNTEVHILTASEPKDGFLATHSLIAAVTALLRAADHYTGKGMDQELNKWFLGEAKKRLEPRNRARLIDMFKQLKPEDTMIIVSDPRLQPMAELLETCAWEAAICSLQHTDFRNFAHGRHVWLAQRETDTFILSLTGTETKNLWSEIDTLIPPGLRRLHFDYDNCGRLKNALGIIDALCFIDAMGNACRIDPGKPGIGDFAAALYEASGIEELSVGLSPAVRQKKVQAEQRDDPQQSTVDFIAEEEKFRARLRGCRFAGLVLDYDGTLVSTESREDPPDKNIIDELERLLDAGLKIAFATGRGGSVGTQLRGQLSEAHHSDILIGYYNGACLYQLDSNIEFSPPAQDPRISTMHHMVFDLLDKILSPHYLAFCLLLANSLVLIYVNMHET